LRCFFIDNSLNDGETFEDATDEEQERFEGVRQEIKTWLSNLPRFDCKDFAEVEKENERLAREIEEAESKLEEEKQRAEE
jgi:hypothetical protein